MSVHINSNGNTIPDDICMTVSVYGLTGVMVLCELAHHGLEESEHRPARRRFFDHWLLRVSKRDEY